MSISKRMLAAGLKAQSHPLASWRSATEWGPPPAAPAPRGKWVNEIGIDLATIADAGFEITPSKCPGFMAVGPNSYTRGTWVPDTTAPPQPPPPAALERHTSNRRDLPGQMTMF